MATKATTNISGDFPISALHPYCQSTLDRQPSPPFRSKEHLTWTPSRLSREQLDNQRVQEYYAKVTTSPRHTTQMVKLVRNARAQARARGAENTPPHVARDTPQYDSWGFPHQNPKLPGGKGASHKPS